MTWIKLVAFGAEALLTFVIVIAATLRIHDAPALYGWRGMLALAVSTAAVTLVAGLGVWSILYRLSTKATRDQDATAPLECSGLRSLPNADSGGSDDLPYVAMAASDRSGPLLPESKTTSIRVFTCGR